MILPAKCAKAFSIHKYFTFRIRLLYCSSERCLWDRLGIIKCFVCTDCFAQRFRCLFGVCFFSPLGSEHLKCVSGGKPTTTDPFDLSV